jgi:hypothetical protein
MIVGSGQFRYRVSADWAKLPDGWSFKESAASMVMTRQCLHVFNRGEHPMIADRQEQFRRS